MGLDDALAAEESKREAIRRAQLIAEADNARRVRDAIERFPALARERGLPLDATYDSQAWVFGNPTPKHDGWILDFGRERTTKVRRYHLSASGEWRPICENKAIHTQIDVPVPLDLELPETLNAEELERVMVAKLLGGA